MHILLVADGRSPIARSWIKTLQPLGYRISLISTYPCGSIDGVNLVATLPVALAKFAGSQAGTSKPASAKKGFTARFRPLLAWVRHQLGPWTLLFYNGPFKKLVNDLQPDLVHALRTPFEGMLASSTPKNIPLIISTWGNDFTWHAPASKRMGQLTRQAMDRADAITTDTRRDINLAQQWGFNASKPSLVVVGNSGLDLELVNQILDRNQRAVPVQIINPRGMRPNVRNDTFFQAIPLILAKHPDVQFVCASMAGQNEAVDWVRKLGIERNVKLLPFLTQTALWEEFARSTISLSISEHDGTPNTLLEAMAFGCLPVCGDIESIREWIEPGVNGELVPPDDPVELAGVINRLLNDPQRYKKWIMRNHHRVNEKADKKQIESKLADFYASILQKK